MNAGYLVSTVIVTWNTREFLRACLGSLLAACRVLAAPVEIIVVDNASSDASAAMVRDEFPSVQLVTNETNVGFAAATNQGVRLSRGTYVLLLNPDTTAAPDFLKELVSFMNAHPVAAAAGARLVDRSGKDQVACFPLPTVAREMWRLFHMDRLRAVATYPFARWGSEIPRNVESIHGACMLLRREALAAIGSLDERFFIYTEEIDLCRRLHDAGWEMFWVPSAVVVHYGGGSTEQVAAPMFLQLYRSKVQYFRKHSGASGALVYKAVLCAASFPRIVLAALGFVVIPSRREKCRALARNYSALLVRLWAL